MPGVGFEPTCSLGSRGVQDQRLGSGRVVLIRISHLGPSPEASAVLDGEHLGRGDGVVDEGQEQGEIEALGVGKVVDIDGDGLGDDCPEVRGPRPSGASTSMVTPSRS